MYPIIMGRDNSEYAYKYICLELSVNIIILTITCSICVDDEATVTVTDIRADGVYAVLGTLVCPFRTLVNVCGDNNKDH